MHAAMYGHYTCIQQLLTHQPIDTHNTNKNKNKNKNKQKQSTSTSRHTSASTTSKSLTKNNVSKLGNKNTYVTYIDIDSVDKAGLTALMYCIQNDFINCVELLISYHADIHILDSNNENALHFAVAHSIRCIPLLLKHNADIYVRNKSRHSTPLITACMLGAHACVELLLEHHQHNRHISDTSLISTATHTTATSSATHTTTPVSAAGRGIHTNAASTSKPSFLSCIWGLSSCVSSPCPLQLSPTRGRYRGGMGSGCGESYIDAVDKLGMTALSTALRYRHVSCIKPLLEHGASAVIANAEGRLPIHYLCEAAFDPSYMSLLLSQTGVEVDALDPTTGMTPLLAVCHRGYHQLAHALLEAGASTDARALPSSTPPPPDTPDLASYTPLMLACSSGHVETVAELLDFGCDTTQTNSRNETAADLNLTDDVSTLLKEFPHRKSYVLK